MTGTEITTAAVGVLGGLAGLGALLQAFFGRGKSRAEAAQIITGTAVSLMNELEEDARAARAEAAQAREEMRAVRDEARKLADELHALRTAIMRPGATVENLRILVDAGRTNGTSNPYRGGTHL